jgi:pimeloyl-ACP methyl ester carboxylesterase
VHGRVKTTGISGRGRDAKRRHEGRVQTHASAKWLVPALLGVAAIGASALYVRKQTRDAEHRHPPVGRFMNVDGVRLHYLERGQGDPLVLIHGNGSLIQDFMISGLVDRLAKRYRVIVFERPGFGYSTRPRRFWTPRAQAQLLRRALRKLGVEKAHVLGHSWGTLVAVSLALDNPSLVQSLVLESGYYYPTARVDVLLVSPPAIPVIGDAMRHTVSPLVAKLLLPKIIEKIFDPAPVPDRFHRLFPKELLLRPSHLRASSEDAALMIPAAMELRHRYHEIVAPVVIVAGTDDQIVQVGRHSERLHHELPGSEFLALRGLGHMVHHSAPDLVIEAIDRAAHRAGRADAASKQDRGAEARWP